MRAHDAGSIACIACLGGSLEPATRSCYFLRVRGRQCYVGEETDVTVTGKHIMAFCKSWRSCAIRSWSGGCKMAGANCAVEKQLPQ